MGDGRRETGGLTTTMMEIACQSAAYFMARTAMDETRRGTRFAFAGGCGGGGVATDDVGSGVLMGADALEPAGRGLGGTGAVGASES